MDPYVAASIQMLKAGFEFGTEVCKTLQTPEGQKALAQMAADRQKWDADWAAVGKRIDAFLTSFKKAD